MEENQANQLSEQQIQAPEVPEPVTEPANGVTSDGIKPPKGKKLTLSRTAIIWICTVSALCVGGIILGVMAANGMFKGDEDSGKCPPSTYRVCGPLADGEVSCTCSVNRYEALKPIIYLYPETNTEVSVTLGHPENLIVSYPAYQDGWHVLAHPSGDLTDLDTGRDFYSLYWEGKDADFAVTDQGFVVKGSDIATFLEEKLPLLGLNSHEAEEFIIYWLPQLQDNAYNYIRFATPEEIENYMPLSITPEPTSTIRVLMLTRPLDTPLDIEEQQLPPTPARDGFTAVEWGGSIIK